MSRIEFMQDGVAYVRRKVAAERVGLQPRLVMRLCQAGVLLGTRRSSTWYVNDASLDSFLADQARQREESSDVSQSEQVSEN